MTNRRRQRPGGEPEHGWAAERGLGYRLPGPDDTWAPPLPGTRRTDDKLGAGDVDAYWRPVWGDQMGGYERIRDRLRDHPERFAHLDAAQLFKHALALRSDVPRRGRRPAPRPILFYVYAEPEVWPASGKAVDDRAKARHQDEIETFAAAVVDDEVSFVSCP